MDRENSRIILRRVGVSLILFGALDIGYMIYCIVHRISYASSFNIFAVISGIYVWKQHPWYLKWVPRATAFFVAGFIMALILFPFLMPLNLQLTALRIGTLRVCMNLLVGLGVTGFLAWVYRELRRPPVLKYCEENGLPTRAPRYAFMSGAALELVVGGAPCIR